MRKKATSQTNFAGKSQRPASTPEARENQLISLAVDLAEQQLRDGTASSQVITHYLKLGSTKERLEKEFMEKQMDLVEAKTDSIKSAKAYEEDVKGLYAEVLRAFKRYHGEDVDDDPNLYGVGQNTNI